jgi:GNAT superfamily N-acetyltransferase
VSGYRFCRTDDIALLVDALNRCWLPHHPDEPPVTPAGFKRWIRDLQVWCSSCMVAFADDQPIGVLIGAKRPAATLVHRVAVHPDHLRQGHGRHMLASLGSKLAILGPPRLVAEVPEALEAACRLFEAAGYVQEAVLTDYVRVDAADVGGSRGGDLEGGLLIPLTVDDLEANGLLGDADPQGAWERAVDTLRARRTEIAGLAVASDERIEACVLYAPSAADPAGAEILALRAFVADDGARLRRLLAGVHATGRCRLRFPKVDPDEGLATPVEALGFRPAGRYRRYGGRAGSA